jgi:hypothetical protein
MRRFVLLAIIVAALLGVFGGARAHPSQVSASNGTAASVAAVHPAPVCGGIPTPCLGQQRLTVVTSPRL